MNQENVCDHEQSKRHIVRMSRAQSQPRVSTPSVTLLITMSEHKDEDTVHHTGKKVDTFFEFDLERMTFSMCE